MGGSDDSLEYTTSWAVALVCSVLIIIALLIEHGLHLLTLYFERRKRKTLNQAIYHLKTELRNLGFMSMLLSMAKNPISRICISRSLSYSLLPCKMNTDHLLFDKDSFCKHQGKVPLMSAVGTGQLQLLIFVLTVFHIFSSLVTFLLGEAMLNKWKSWEEETKTLDFQLSNDPRRFELTRKTSFGRRHLKLWSDYPLLLWIVCSVRQLIKPVSRADYYALRRGFLMVHFNKDFQFDFHKFLSRSLDHDFAVVVRISTWTWVYAILMIFFNASEFHSRYWPPFIPLAVILTVGMKLEVIITTMCLKGTHEAVVVPGTVSVMPDNSLFWFGQPQLLLRIIQLVLIQNSFQLAYFTWSWYSFGLESCFHNKVDDFAIIVGIGLLVHFLCAYVTLPLYALVSQMGTSMRESIFTDRVIDGLKNWHRTARRSLEEKGSCTLSSPSTGTAASLSSEENSVHSGRNRTLQLGGESESQCLSRIEAPKSIEGKTKSSCSSSSVEPFSFLTPGESSSSNTRRSNVQEFRYPSDRIELMEVQKVVEEIMQCGAKNVPHSGEVSFNLWRKHSK